MQKNVEKNENIFGNLLTSSLFINISNLRNIIKTFKYHIFWRRFHVEPLRQRIKDLC